MGVGGSQGRPEPPRFAQHAAWWGFGGDDYGGLLGEAQRALAAAPPIESIMGGLDNLIGQGDLGGQIMRQLTAEATNQGYGNTMQLANMSFGPAQQAGEVLNMLPGFFDAANQFAQQGNTAQRQFDLAFGNAGQSLANVMNPTAYNPLFQNAMENQITPALNAAYSARGLGSSGPAIQAISEAGRDLSNQFAQRQFAEQQQGIGTLGGLAQGAGGLAATLAQTPGQVLGQLMSGVLGGGQAIGQAMQNQLGPLSLLGQGAANFQQGLGMPLQTRGSTYDLTRGPLNNLISNVVGTIGIGSHPKGYGFLGLGGK